MAAWSMPRAPPETRVRLASAVSRPMSFGVFDQRVVHVPRADDSQSTCIENRGIATPVKNRRRILLEARLQSPRILGIGAAHHPDRPCLPALDRLAQQKAAGQQALEPVARR